MSEELYNLPEYYDIAFTWDITREAEFFARILKQHVPFPTHISEELGNLYFILTAI